MQIKTGKRRWIAYLVWIGEAAIIVSLMVSLVNLIQKKDIVKERQAVLAGIEAEHQKLTEQLKEAQSLPFIERQAREKLGLVRPGEMIVLLGKQNFTSGGSTGEDSTSNWRKWWKLFF